MDYQDTLDLLNIQLGDTGNITFTPEEKERALTKAWNDQYVVADVWNTAGAFNVSSYQTAIPTGITTVKDIGIRASTSDFPESISNDYYDIVGTNIQWSQSARYGLTDGTGLYILGAKKLDPDVDTLDTVALQEYVVALGSVNTLSLLMYKKANLFLKNDVSVGELTTMKRELQKDVENMRARFAKNFQDI